VQPVARVVLVDADEIRPTASDNSFQQPAVRQVRPVPGLALAGQQGF
jgi:hypothetical protein